MLQQTQVSRVEAYYHRFLDRYPSVESLAAAPGAVREAWEGLGYYRRAANLHQTGPAGDPPSTGGVIPPTRRAAACRASDGTPPGRWRALPTSARRRRWIPTSQGFSGGPSIRDGEAWGRQEALGHRRGAGTASGKAGVGVQPGDHGARRAHLTARVARCGECPVRESCRTEQGAEYGERGTGNGNGGGRTGTGITAQNGGCATRIRSSRLARGPCGHPRRVATVANFLATLRLSPV